MKNVNASWLVEFEWLNRFILKYVVNKKLLSETTEDKPKYIEVDRDDLENIFYVLYTAGVFVNACKLKGVKLENIYLRELFSKLENALHKKGIDTFLGTGN